MRELLENEILKEAEYSSPGAVHQVVLAKEPEGGFSVVWFWNGHFRDGEGFSSLETAERAFEETKNRIACAGGMEVT